MRIDGRQLDELRPFSLEPGFITQAQGSVLVTSGRTRVICTASVESRTPGWLQSGGWVTAEYAMLPGATPDRGRRNPGGRGKEIQRLIARSLRAAVDLPNLVDVEGNGLSIVCDCDVIEADGGTRTASITGAWVALYQCLARIRADGRLAPDHNPLTGAVAAVSVGIVPAEGTGSPVGMLDLQYHEDHRALVDFNVVARDEADGLRLVEVQGTGEDGTFDRKQLDTMLDLAETGLANLYAAQTAVLAES